MNKKWKSRRRNLAFTALSTLLLMCALGFLITLGNLLAPRAIATAEHPAPAIAKHGNAVSLSGAEAIQQLKQQGTYESLAEAVAAAPDPTLHQQGKLHDDSGPPSDGFGPSPPFRPTPPLPP